MSSRAPKRARSPSLAVNRPPVTNDRDVVAQALAAGARFTTTTTTTTTTVEPVQSPLPPPVGVPVAPEAMDVEEECATFPSMKQRSRAEVVFDCYWLVALGKLSMANLVKALNTGYSLGLTDAAFTGYDGIPAHAMEYDDGFWHDEARVGGDVRKTQRLLRESPDMLVCRIRLDAPPLGMEHARLIVAEGADRHPGRAVSKMALAFAAHPSVSEELRERLKHSARNVARNKQADQLAHNFFLKADAAYKQAIRDLEDVVGSPEAARRVLEKHGVVTRLDVIVVGLKRFRDELGVPVADLPTLLSSGVAAAVEHPAFWRGIDTLKAMGVPGAKLPTFMCDGVASALVNDPEAFWRGIDTLKAMGVPGAKLPTIMCGGVASALVNDPEAFWRGIDTLKDMGVPGDKLPTFMCNGVASAIVTNPDAFWRGIETLKDMGVPGDKLLTFMCGGVASAIVKNPDAFWRGIETLKAMGVPGAKLPTFMCDGVASALVNDPETFMTLLTWLLTDVNVSVDKLASFGGSFFSTDEAIVHETITMLTEEYGVRPEDLPARCAFWSHVKKPAKLAELRAYLATCKTTGAVTMRLAKLNGSAGLGRGAIKCKFVRPKLVQERVELPTATKQAKLGAFFSAKSDGAGSSGSGV